MKVSTIIELSPHDKCLLRVALKGRIKNLHKLLDFAASEHTKQFYEWKIATHKELLNRLK
jgi:hypothetical protein